LSTTRKGSRNSETRYGRSRNAIRGSKKTKNKCNNKKNINRRRDQQSRSQNSFSFLLKILFFDLYVEKKKKSTNVVSLISSTTSNLVQPSEEFHRETNE